MTSRGERAPIVAECHGIVVPDAPHLGPGMIAALNAGRYERREFEAARALIPEGARILELGAGSGFVGAAIARACKPESMLAIEANASLLPHIEALYDANRLDDAITVRHAVVLAGDDTPDSVTFHVLGNFLGSGLTVAKRPSKASAVDVPVLRYDALKAEFPHDTIVMDIEGAERDFLENADLSGVNTIILETHRSLYGRDGIRACKQALAAAGFEMVGEVSRGGVQAWRRKGTVLPRPPAGPAQGETFTGRIDHMTGAVVVPERPHDARLACGVLDSAGNLAPLSTCWIRARKTTVAPTLGADEPVETLAGRHLFAGHLRGHFGHFLVESTARLWALSALRPMPDGILYLPYGGKPRRARQALRSYRAFLDCLGIDIPITILTAPTRIDELILPELGFGWGARFAGSPAYRSFMHDRLVGACAAAGSEDLYVSRSRLRADKGGMIGETIIEENLARMGYEVFHPEAHDIRTQLGRYRAARRIVALDGSALHLAAFVAQPGTRVAILLRRSKANHADYTRQFRSFAGITPDIVDAIKADWASGPRPKSNFRSVGEADFELLFRRLGDLGYLPPGARPDLPDATVRERMVSELAERRGDGLTPI